MNKDKMELEEAIKLLREMQSNALESYNNLRGNYRDVKAKDKAEAIETVLEALEKLQQDNYKLDRENQQLFESQINSIPKKKIEDKIKELKNKKTKDIHVEYAYMTQINTLQELLEDR